MSSRKCVSLRQMVLLVEYLEKHRDIALGQLRSKEARAYSSHLWTKCADILNADTEGDKRTPKMWNKWYTDYKCRLLSRAKAIKKQQSTEKSGEPAPQLSPIEERLCTLISGHIEDVGSNVIPHNEDTIIPPGYNQSHGTTESAVDNIKVLVDAAASENVESEDLIRLQENHGTVLTNKEEIDVKLSLDITAVEKRNDKRKGPSRRIPKRQRRRRRPSLSPRRSPSSSPSRSERAQNQLVALEQSRIEVERLMAAAYTKMADAMYKSAEAQCRIASALEKIHKDLQRSNTRSPESEY